MKIHPQAMLQEKEDIILCTRLSCAGTGPKSVTAVMAALVNLPMDALNCARLPATTSRKRRFVLHG